MWLDQMTVPPRVMARAHLSQVVLWTAMIPVSLLTSLKDSVPYLVTISILALVFSELSAWQGSLAERRLDTTDEFGDEGNPFRLRACCS